MSERFTITSADGQTPVICGDDSGSALGTGIVRESIIDHAPGPDTTWQVQTVMPARAVGGRCIGRGNGLLTFEWTVARTHRSIVDGMMFRRDHAGSLPQLGINTLTWSLNGTLAKSSGALSALSWVQAQCYGVRTVVTYHWQGTLFVPASLAN